MITRYYYQNDFDKDWSKHGRIFFVFNLDDGEEIFYIHDVREGKFYKNYDNDNDRFHDVDEYYSNFKLTKKIIK
jgi:hypothetical protein